MICRGEGKDDRVKWYISYVKVREKFWNVLLGAGSMILQPAAGDIICIPNVGLPFFRMAAMRKNRKVIVPTVDQVKSLTALLMNTLYDSDCAIRRIFLHIDIDECVL